MFLRELVAKRRRIVWVEPTVTARAAAEAMAAENVGCTAVVEGGSLVGILTERDLVRRLLLAGLEADRTPVSDIMTRDPVVGRARDQLARAAKLMRENHVRHLPVMDEDGALLGVLSIRDLLREEIQDMRDYITQKEG